MNPENSYCATIPPVPEDTHRPLWSVMIPTYNCANYLRETLTSVLAQDPGPEIMQIEVIDDQSTKDDPQAVVEELGKGRVGFYRQPQNVGHTKNFETCLTRSRGKLIHLLHGDDCVRDGFYQKMQKGFEIQPDIGSAFCRSIFIDEHSQWQNFNTFLAQNKSGIVDNWLEQIALQQLIYTPAVVVRREVYENLGGFDTRLSWSEDWEMWTRIAAYYPVWYEIEPLAMYRVHSSSNTGKYIKMGENIKDLRRAIDIIQFYLPDDIVKKISKKSKDLAVLQSHYFSRKMVAERELIPAIIQINEGLKCGYSISSIRSLSFFLIWAIWKVKKYPFLYISKKLKFS